MSQAKAKSKTKTKPSVFFLTSLLVSLVGNAISDYAIMWYAISEFNLTPSSLARNSVSLFYIGQAIGVIFLAPVLAVIFDRHSKRIASITVDSSYAFVLIGVAATYKLELLSPSVILIATVLLKGLSTLHLSSVVLSAIKEMSSSENKNRLITNYVATITISTAVGAGISGIVYKSLGFVPCMMTGVITFIPALYCYFRIFPAKKIQLPQVDRNLLKEYKEGYSYLFKDKILTGTVLSIAAFNIVGSLFPAMLGISLDATYPGNSQLFSIIIGFGLLIGVSLKNIFERESLKVGVRFIVPLSLLPCIIAGVIAFFFPHPMAFAALYILACCGSSFRNFVTGSLRVNRVEQSMMGRVNSVYMVILFSGQALGGLLVIPLFQRDIQNGLLLTIGICILAASISLMALPRTKLKILTEESA